MILNRAEMDHIAVDLEQRATTADQPTAAALREQAEQLRAGINPYSDTDGVPWTWTSSACSTSPLTH